LLAIAIAAVAATVVFECEIPLERLQNITHGMAVVCVGSSSNDKDNNDNSFLSPIQTTEVRLNKTGALDRKMR